MRPTESDLFERISGKDALLRVLDGESVYHEKGTKYQFERGIVTFYDREHGMNVRSKYSVNKFLDGGWYVRKPYKVQEHLLAKPNEWVAVLYDKGDHVYRYIGFDTETMTVVCSTDNTVPVDYMDDKVGRISIAELEECFPVEELEGRQAHA